MKTNRILLVEDEENLREVIALNLESEGYAVVSVSNGVDALKVYKEEKFNLVILDIMIPKIDGYDVCESIRLNDTETPILFLSAKGSAEDRIEGLKKGGDDYLSKPFNLEELILRVQKLIERSMRRENNTDSGQGEYQFAQNKVYFNKNMATNFKGETMTLTRLESKFLKLLTENEGNTVSREHILHTVWGYQVYPSSRSIDNFVVAFRKYFEPDPKNPKHFISVRGIGYCFYKDPI